LGGIAWSQAPTSKVPGQPDGKTDVRPQAADSDTYDLILLAPNPGQIVERLHLDFGQRYAAGESARAIKSDPRFIETREHVLAKVFSQRSAVQRQERA